MVIGSSGSGSGTPGRNDKPGAASGSANKKHKSVSRMLPLFSRWSIIVLVIGLTIGILGGFGYWAISPSLNSTDSIAQEDTSQFMFGNYEGPYESAVNVQIVNPGSSYVHLADLQRAAEYYAAKANTFPFLDYLTQELEESAPMYSHSTEELDQMISIRYDSNSDVALIEIKTIGATMEETIYLTAFIPMVFKDFLAAEEDKLRLEEYESLVEDIDNVRLTLLESEQEIADFALDSTTHNIYNDKTHISLVAKVEALQEELGDQARLLATMIASGDNETQSYLDIVAAVERTSITLAEAKSELSILEAQHDIQYTTQNLDYQIAKGRVDNLSQELATLTDRMTSLLAGNDDTPTALEYMVVGKPSAPIPSIDRIRGRDAMLLGGILGVGFAWVSVNFKWVINGMPSSNVRRREEEEENEETA